MKKPSTAEERMTSDEAELAELEKAREAAENPPEEDTEPTKPEEKMWKKRHDDGRRYMERMKADHAAAIKKLEDTVESMRGQIRRSDALPKTEAEVEAYATENPETFAMLTSVIGRKLNEREEAVNEKFERLEKAKVQTQEEIAKQKLMSLHDGSDKLPTYAELEVSDDFHTWVAEQSDTFSKALYENAADWKSAHSVIEAYKNMLRAKAKTGKRTKAQVAADAAGMVTPSAAPVTPTGDTSGYLFSESQIKKMTDEEFEAQESAIAEAGRAGKILLDEGR
jgi:hypothetical protein